MCVSRLLRCHPASPEEQGPPHTLHAPLQTDNYTFDPFPDLPADFGPDVPEDGLDALLLVRRCCGSCCRVLECSVVHCRPARQQRTDGVLHHHTLVSGVWGAVQQLNTPHPPPV
jgi:hypothetical protein